MWRKQNPNSIFKFFIGDMIEEIDERIEREDKRVEEKREKKEKETREERGLFFHF